MKKNIIEIFCLILFFGVIAASSAKSASFSGSLETGVSEADANSNTASVRISEIGTIEGLDELIAAAEEREKTYDPEYLYGVLSDLSGKEKMHTFETKKTIREKTQSKIKNALKQLEDGGAEVSFLVMDLLTGEGFAKDELKTYYSASSIKGPYVCSIASLEPEKVLDYKDTITQTITVSSNSGYEYLWRTFGPDDMKQWFKEAGVTYPDTVEYYLDLTSVDFAKLWVRNWEFFESDEENADWVKDVFDRSYNSVINEELADKSTKVYSKPGWIADSWYGIVQNDAGVVVHKDADPYLIVVLSSAYGQNEKLHELVGALDTAILEMEK